LHRRQRAQNRFDPQLALQLCDSVVHLMVIEAHGDMMSKYVIGRLKCTSDGRIKMHHL